MTGSNAAALDTNVAIALLNDVPTVVAWLGSFDSLYLPLPVIGELLYGAMNSSRPAENVAKVESLVARCRVFPMNHFEARVYADLRLHLKKLGRPVPENDLWIAACCVQRQLPLATYDAHFAVMPNLKLLDLP